MRRRDGGEVEIKKFIGNNDRRYNVWINKQITDRGGVVLQMYK